MSQDALERYARVLESLNADSVGSLRDCMTEDVRFRDPFNDVTGLDRTIRIFEHMFEALTDVRFVVMNMAVDQNEPECGMILWRLDAMFRGNPYRVDGMSEVRLSSDGRVIQHIDHWDSGRQFYERLPIVGWLIRGIRRRLTVA
jgi:hypothetical protein